jgi:solute:Na+ symporter, SSS family
MFIAISTALIMIAYIDLNIEGLGAVLYVVTGGRLNLPVSAVIVFAVLSVAVFVGGIRGNAWQAVVKDVLMFIAIGAPFFVVPFQFFGGFGPMFQRLATEIPQRITMPGPTHELGELWLATTVLLTGLGMWMWPHWFSVAFTARSPRTLKLQAVLMPLYQVVKIAVITIGFAAILIFAGQNVAGNDVVMLLGLRTFPTWFAALFALAAVLLLTKHSIVLGMNAGFVALCANLVIFFVVSLPTRPVEREVLDRFFATIYGRWALGFRAEAMAGVAAGRLATQAGGGEK